jgi:hypothetical protein
MDDFKKKKPFLDSVLYRSQAAVSISLKEALKTLNFYQDGYNESTLFSHGRRSKVFFTEDSRLYILPRELGLKSKRIALQKNSSNLDSLSAKIIKDYQACHRVGSGILYEKLVRRYAKINQEITIGAQNFAGWIKSPIRVWNFSIVGAILFGMISMTFIYRYLGQGVSAESMQGAELISSSAVMESQNSSPLINPSVLGAETYSGAIKGDKDESDGTDYILEVIQNLENTKKEEFEREIRKTVKGYPIEEMIPYISEKDKIVAAFIIGIAKKESNWGKRIPRLNGQDCYNYWGYRGIRKLMGTGGHTCFNSRKDAVDTVAKRIEWLIKNRDLNTPSKMVIWKCGSACHEDNPEAVRKWISDVSLYFDTLND